MEGYIYVIKDTVDNTRKMGYSKHPDTRLKQVSTGNPHKLIIEYRLQVQDMRKAEAGLHTLFAAQRGNREWFLLDTNEALTLLEIVFTARELTAYQRKMLQQLGLRS